MYSAKPLGINRKENDYDVADGFLLESINMQWRDGALRPVPERIISTINTSGYSNIILHKVSDENQINVLGFKTANPYINVLYWFGTITNGTYEAKVTPVGAFITKTAGMSFTILNGLIYFMGDGSSSGEQYYHRIQFLDTSNIYEYKNMYAWKNLIPFYPFQNTVTVTAPSKSVNVYSQCGFILIRFAAVLKSGEVVLHSPIYPFSIYGINRSASTISKGSPIENIHTFVNMNVNYDPLLTLFNEEMSAINFYATTPYYESVLTTDYAAGNSFPTLVTSETIIGQIATKSQEPFYLIKTISAPSTDTMLLTVDQLDIDITTTIATAKIDISTIAAGEVMPVDNFSYHQLFGQLSSNNGRIIINKPTTVLSPGHIRSLATVSAASDVGFKIDTEDGKISGIAYTIDKALDISTIPTPSPGHELVAPRGILSYPDARATLVGGSKAENTSILLFKTSRNELHNLACALNIVYAGFDISISTSGTNILCQSKYSIFLNYWNGDEPTGTTMPIVSAKYSSENRIQFGAAGEFSVWPAINSYRIGEGKIMAIGSNSVNPADTLTVAPLIVGTTDGVYTINLDPSGNNLVASITKNASIPYISKETLQIDDQLLFISDRGLMAYNGGEPVSLTEDYFPDQGNGNFTANNTIYPNYDLITNSYSSILFTVDDIVDYLKGAILAYDSRRETIWCSNPLKDYSLTYGLKTRLWGFNTLVFTQSIELFSTIGGIYSRYLVKTSVTNLLVLSGEDLTKEVTFHLMTRPLKLQNPDGYKRIGRLISRCEYFRKNVTPRTGYFTFGLWGKQDANKNKENIPLVAISDISAGSFPSDVRQDIGIGALKGKYKFVTILQGGKALPESSISRYDIEAYLVDDKQLR